MNQPAFIAACPLMIDGQPRQSGEEVPEFVSWPLEVRARYIADGVVVAVPASPSSDDVTPEACAWETPSIDEVSHAASVVLARGGHVTTKLLLSELDLPATKLMERILGKHLRALKMTSKPTRCGGRLLRVWTAASPKNV